MDINSIYKRHNRIKLWEWFGVFTMYFSHLTYFNPDLYHFSLWILTPISFVLCFIFSNNLKENKYLRIVLLLFIWCTFTSLFAIDATLAKAEVQRIWGVFAYCYIMASLCRKRRLSLIVFGAYIALLINCIFYAYNNMLELMIASNSRLNSKELNANFFGYQLLAVTYITYIYGEVFHGFWRKFFRVFLFVLIPLSFYIAILTASRQILLLQIPCFFCLLYKRYLKFSVKGILAVVTIVIAIGVALSKWGIDAYENSYLKVRSQTEVTEDSRFKLLGLAIKTGISNPFVGVGPGCFKVANPRENAGAFSHCSYVELFANSGLIAMILYVYMVYLLLAGSYKSLRHKNKYAYIFFLYSVFYAIDNFFYVFYLDPTLLSFFIGVTSYSNLYLKN